MAQKRPNLTTAKQVDFVLERFGVPKTRAVHSKLLTLIREIAVTPEAKRAVDEKAEELVKSYRNVDVDAKIAKVRRERAEAWQDWWGNNGLHFTRLVNGFEFEKSFDLLMGATSWNGRALAYNAKTFRTLSEKWLMVFKTGRALKLDPKTKTGHLVKTAMVNAVFCAECSNTNGLAGKMQGMARRLGYASLTDVEDWWNSMQRPWRNNLPRNPKVAFDYVKQQEPKIVLKGDHAIVANCFFEIADFYMRGKDARKAAGCIEKAYVHGLLSGNREVQKKIFSFRKGLNSN